MVETDGANDVRDPTPDEEYAMHLIRAEYHIRHAMNILFESGGPKRSIVCRTLLARAYGIILGLYNQESRNQRKGL